MNVMKSIGASFTKLWRWIRETAWVQPLLIVGAIFSVIFAIPKFTNWFQALGLGENSAYFTSFQVTLEGETDEFDDLNTRADKLTETIYRFSNFEGSEYEYASYAEYSAALEAGITFTDGSTTTTVHPLSDYGEKFYLVYYADNDTSVDSAREGFYNLDPSGNAFWNTRYSISDGLPFNVLSINSDYDSVNDDDYDGTDDNDQAFVRYLDKFSDRDFFALAGERLDEDCVYHHNASISDDNYTAFTEGDHDSFYIPTILLIDFTEAAYNLGRPGVSEVIFGVSGSDSYAKAELLVQMWNHTDADNTNPFSESYVAK